MLEGRKEARTPVRLLVHILSVRDPRLTELVAVENLSPRGARVTAQRSWELGSHVVIKSPSGVLGDRARVVYCQKVGEKRFTLGLDFITQTSDWDSRNDKPGAKAE